MEALLARYGLLAILVGAGIEGEAVVIAGGVVATPPATKRAAPILSV